MNEKCRVYGQHPVEWAKSMATIVPRQPLIDRDKLTR